MENLGIIWNNLVVSFWESLDPHTIVATILFAIPALLVAWMIWYFQPKKD